MFVLDNLTTHIQDIQVRIFGGYNQSINFYYKTMVFKATMLFTQSEKPSLRNRLELFQPLLHK